MIWARDDSGLEGGGSSGGMKKWSDPRMRSLGVIAEAREACEGHHEDK